MPLYSVSYFQGYRAATRVSTVFFARDLGFAVLVFSTTDCWYGFERGPGAKFCRQWARNFDKVLLSAMTRPVRGECWVEGPGNK